MRKRCKGLKTKKYSEIHSVSFKIGRGFAKEILSNYFLLFA